MFSKKPQSDSVKDAARDVVERARAGDQVAMGILAMVRDNAKAGDPKARKSFKVMEDYIRHHPPQNFGVCDVTHSESLRALWSLNAMPPQMAVDAVVAETPKVKFWQAVVAIVHGPKDDSLVSGVAKEMPLESLERKSFMRGIQWNKEKPTEAVTGFWNLGRMFGIGRAIQRLADNSIPIAVFCPVTAWELGE
jgi:hypothetical protein